MGNLSNYNLEKITVQRYSWLKKTIILFLYSICITGIYIYNNPIYVYVQIKQNKKSSSAENIKKIHCTYVAYINQKQKSKSFVSFFKHPPQKKKKKKKKKK